MDRKYEILDHWKSESGDLRRERKTERRTLRTPEKYLEKSRTLF